MDQNQAPLIDQKDKCFLVVIRMGEVRMLPISRLVAAELIANGMSYGN